MPFHEVCPYRIGSRVKIAPTHVCVADWPADYTVVAIMWEYQKGDGTGVNIAIASDDEIKHRNGWTDGWKIDDLLPAERS